MQSNEKTTPTPPADEQKGADAPKPKRKHLIRSPWIRRPLKVLGGLLFVLILIPALLYFPPVQDFAVKTASGFIADKTGMKVEIGRLRLRFPVNLSLDDLCVVEASGDTMVRARQALVDVKLMPLLKLDAQIKKLRLRDAYYRMLSPDSSMLMTIRAGLLDVDDKSSADIRNSTISLNDAYLRDGEIALDMNVWKQKPTPKDTASTPFLIKANSLKLDNILFSMSMLPTIDTLRFNANHLVVSEGNIDLRQNLIRISDVIASKGSALMLAPSAEYVKNNPAPPADTTSVSEPTTIVVDNIQLNEFDARYAVQDAPKVKGFDASDIRFSSLSLAIQDFYNQATVIKLPITEIRGMEQCGLSITEGSGVFAMDSTGMMLRDFDVRTPFSHLQATAAIPNALLEFLPEATLDVDLTASVGMNDISAFMPDLNKYISAIPQSTPLNARVRANGLLGDAAIEQFDVALPGTLSLRADGHARNALDFKNLIAELKFNGELRRPQIIKSFVDLPGVDVPTLSIEGNARADHENYAADFRLSTPHGRLAADGKVGMNSELYKVNLNVHNLNVGAFIGDKTIGPVSANISAVGAGFNPEKRGAHTDIKLDLASAVYNGHSLRDITFFATLKDEDFTLKANSTSPILDFDIYGNGRISDNFYQADINADLRHVDLKALGFSETDNSGSARLHLIGNASPHTWLYNIDLTAEAIDWKLPDLPINIPDPLALNFVSTDADTRAALVAKGLNMDFESHVGLESVVQKFSEVASMVPKMIEARKLDVKEIEEKLPPFTLSGKADGKGIASVFINPSGMGFGSLSLDLVKDSLINGNIILNSLRTESMRLDTITFGLKSRGALLDYNVHLGNRPGTLDEFAQVNMSGYLGDNRLSAYLVQHNIKKKMGYRVGLTAAVADSVVSVRFTPLKATIAYLPWTFNLNNYIDYTLTNRKVNANLMASSAESSILLKTEKNEQGFDNLHLNLKNIKVEDFLHMALNPPPVKATLNSDINVRYTGRALVGKGNLDIEDFYFDKKRVGDLNFTLRAGMGNKGKSAGKIGLVVDGNEAAAVQFVLAPDSINPDQGLIAERLNLALTKFPLKIANPFFPPQSMRLAGALNGEMSLTGSFLAPVLNGSISCDSVSLFMNMLGTNFRFSDNPITLTDNILDFHQFKIFAVNDNPLILKGTVDATKISDLKFDLAANASNIQLTGAKGSAGADITGKLFLDLGATVKGPMSFMDINANVNVLPTTDVTYNMVMGSDAISGQSGSANVVKFVNFADSTAVAKADSLSSVLGMRINAKASISPGTQITVNMQGGDVGSGKVICNPSGTLNYFQNYVGDMRLNGTLYTGTGSVNYNVPILGKKNFSFDQNSHITWNGDILNPSLAIKATDMIKSNVQMNGNARLVNFLVTLNIANTLSAPSVVFDLSCDDDMSISNELQSMTADQRQQQAMTLMLTGTYTGQNAKTVNSNLATGKLYDLLASQLNSLASSVVKGVDINFGVDQYQTGSKGNMSTNTSYSYQVSKSLINNRFKIIVGGNYSTDASADENFQQNLISDIAFEYVLRQTNNMSLNAKLFRHTGFESVLEGEITETGIALSLRRRLAFFTEITHFGLSKLWKKKKTVTIPVDSIPHGGSNINAMAPVDSINYNIEKDDDAK